MSYLRYQREVDDYKDSVSEWHYRIYGCLPCRVDDPELTTDYVDDRASRADDASIMPPPHTRQKKQRKTKSENKEN